MHRTFFISLFIFLVSCSSSTSGQNIAKGKKYTFSEKPNYALTEGSDDTDLTDGVKKSIGRFWTHKSTVGWNYISEISVDVNLGEVYSIEGALITTVRGSEAGVMFPLSCHVFTSLDNNFFEYQGDLMLSDDNSSGGYKVNSFRLDGIETQGQYIKFVFTANGKFLFLDEIEVFGRRTSHIRNDKRQLIGKSDLDSFVKEALNQSMETRSAIRRIESVKKYLGDFVSDDFELDAKLDINQIIKKNQNRVLPEGVMFTPINSIEVLDNFTLNNALEYQNKPKSSRVIYASNGLNYFSLINNKSTPQSITFQISDDLDCMIYEILPVVSQNRVNIRDALNPVSSNILNIEPGENKYFVVKSFKQNYIDGNLQIIASEQGDLLGKIIYPSFKLMSSQQNKELNVNLWAYLDKPVLKENLNFVINDLENAGVDVIVIHSVFIDGYNTKDFGKLKKYLKNFKNLKDKKILLFYNFRSNAERKFNSEAFLDITWKYNFKKWYTLMQRQLKSIGVNENEVYFYPYDEIKLNEVNNFVELAKWGKTSIPNFKTFLTINNESLYRAARSADIVQIPMNTLKKIKDKIDNGNIWIYEAFNQSRERDPYTDYRLMSWFAYYYDLKGVGFWNYSSLTSESLAYFKRINNGNSEYSVIYLNDNKEVLLSLRWLCFQQGLKDYQILKTYENLVGRTNMKKIVKNVIDNPGEYARADEALRSLIEPLK